MRPVALSLSHALLALGLLACSSSRDPSPSPPAQSAPPPPAEPAPAEEEPEREEGIRIVATSAPEGATVTEGGRVLGTTPLSITVPVPPARPGRPGAPPLFALTFTAPGHRSTTLYASATEGTVNVSAVLAEGEDPAEPSAVGAAEGAPVGGDASGLPFAPGQRWTGSYICSQGRTALVLRISEVQGDRVSAVFDFHHRALGMHGSFTLAGRYQADPRQLRMRPIRWIRQPGRWRMVGMNGRVSDDGRTYSGRITDYGSCRSFSVQREQS